MCTQCHTRFEHRNSPLPHTRLTSHCQARQSMSRAFLAQYSSSTRRTRRVVLPGVCCTHVESDARIDFPTSTRVGRVPTSQATIECLHSARRRSRRTSQLTRARDAPYSCEYSACVAKLQYVHCVTFLTRSRSRLRGECTGVAYRIIYTGTA